MSPRVDDAEPTGDCTETPGDPPPDREDPGRDEARDAKPSGRKLPTGDHPELIQLWEALFEGVTGSKASINFGKDGAVLAKQLERHGRETIEARMRLCFDQRLPDWAWRDGAPSLAVFLGAACFDKLARVTPVPQSRRPANGRMSASDILSMDLNHGN